MQCVGVIVVEYLVLDHPSLHVMLIFETKNRHYYADSLKN
jgi:hypothetical protein